MLGLRTTIYNVGDLNAAKSWYSKAFRATPYFDEPYYVGFNICGYELGLLPNKTPPKEKGESVFAYWGVEDVDKSYNHMLSLGAEVHEAPKNVGGELMVATVKDPWGNIVGLIYNPDFKVG